MCLVDHDVLKAEFLQCRLLDETDFVGSDAHIEILRDEAGRDELGTLFFRARENDRVDVGSPLAEFASPVLERGLGNNNEMRTRCIRLVF